MVEAGADEYIKRIREHIDRIDNVILVTLAERMALMPVSAKHKKARNLPVEDNERYLEQITKFRKLAEENELDPGFVEEIFLTILDKCKNLEIEHYNREDILQDERY